MRIILSIILVAFINIIFCQGIWEPITIPDSVTAKGISAEKEGVLFFVAGANGETSGLYRSFDDGNTWEIIKVHPNSYTYPVRWAQHSPDKVLYVGLNNGIYRSIDDGDNFENVLYGEYGYGLKFRPDSSIYLYGGNYFMMSDNNCETWDTLCNLLEYDYFTFKDIDFGLDGEIYAVGGDIVPWGGGFFRSFDNGRSWENIGLTENHLQSICVNQEGEIIVGGFSYGAVFHSNDSGETWIVGNHMFADEMNSYDNYKLIAGGNINSNTGCWFSENWGVEWIDISEGLSYPAVRDISIAHDNSVYIVTEYNATDLYKSNNPIVGVKTKKTKTKLNLYPNPASDYLVISGVQAEDIRNLKIYNSSGQLLRNESKNTDRIDISQLEKGIYLIDVQTKNNHHQRKIIKN